MYPLVLVPASRLVLPTRIGKRLHCELCARLIHKRHEPDDVLKVYFEVESLLLQDHLERSFHRIVESALRDTLRRLGASNRYDPVLLKGACEDFLRLGLYLDVQKTIDALCSQGITVIGLAVPGASLFALPPLPQSFI